MTHEEINTLLCDIDKELGELLLSLEGKRDLNNPSLWATLLSRKWDIRMQVRKVQCGLIAAEFLPADTELIERVRQKEFGGARE